MSEVQDGEASLLGPADLVNGSLLGVGSGDWVSIAGFRVSGFGSRVSSFGLRVYQHALLDNRDFAPPHGKVSGFQFSGDTTPCRMTGVTLHSHVCYKEI